ncbi:MAG TPA: hypothetical protein VGD54_07510, partial [Steroidobacteraceae bacterium]
RIDGLRVVDEGLQASDIIVVNGLQHAAAGAKVQTTRVSMSTNGSGLAQVAIVNPPVEKSVLVKR